VSDTREAVSLAGAEADPDIGFTYNELLAELVGEYSLKVRPTNSVTAPEMSEATGRSWSYCKKILDRMVEEGKLTGELWLINGKRTMMYWKP